MMPINSILHRLGLSIHLLHEKAYSYYKARKSGMLLRLPLTAAERPYFLQFYPYLQGVSLTVFDIGASVGTLSGCFAKIPTIARIDAFEPIPAVFKQLSNRMQGYPQVICHNVGLGDANGQMDMYVTDQALATSSFLKMDELHKQEFPSAIGTHKETLRVVKLDEYVFEKQLPIPHLIKIDVQGFEEKVIHGGRATISKTHFCCVEISLEQLYLSSPLFDDIYNLMVNLGFRLVGLDSIIKGKSGKSLQVDGIFQNAAMAT
jgi:FkbM family methyltransferase